MLVALFTTLFQGLITGYVSNKIYKLSWHSSRKLPIEETKNLTKDVGALAVFKFCRTLNSTIDTLLISKFIAVSLTAIYGSVTIITSGLGTLIDTFNDGKIPNTKYSNNTSIQIVEIGDGITSFGINTFYGCSSLTTITIPDSVTSIGDRSFYNCTSLTSVTIPSGVTSISSYLFSGCTSLTSVTIPDSVTKIRDWAFQECTSLTSVVIPDGVTYIGYKAFAHCTSLTSVTIPDSVENIEDGVFEGCTNLTSAPIPNSVREIGVGTFIKPLSKVY